MDKNEFIETLWSVSEANTISFRPGTIHCSIQMYLLLHCSQVITITDPHFEFGIIIVDSLRIMCLVKNFKF